jgi:hypothetical protein
LDKFGLPYHVEGRTSVGDWCQNCAQKAAFVREMMLRHEGRPLVWLDADARVIEYPYLFDTMSCDFAAHWFNGRELLSGTLYFGPTPAAWVLVQQWVSRCEAEPNVWDQVNLQAAVDADPALAVGRLPVEYAYIVDCRQSKRSVVLHTQASRRYKRMIHA